MIKRNLLNQLKSHIPKKEISFIVGPRQAGKTTLMLLLKDNLEKKGERCLFLNLDIEADKQFLVSQAMLMRKIQLELGKTKGYVFIDEIQRRENAGVFLKGIYDMNLPYKFIVSGSGSVDLKEKIHESLVGRKRIFELRTLSFEEFFHHKTEYRYEDKALDFFQTDKTKSLEILNEYCIFGGYPRVVLEDTLEEKREQMKEIYQSYLEKDISYLLKVKKTEAFSSLVKVTASQIGNMINYSELSSSLGLSIATIKHYLWYLDKTFIVKKITPYFRNIRKEITKSPMFYFHDLGMRNFALSLFTDIPERQDVGFLFQNFIFNNLCDELGSVSVKIHFWRTKDKAEVDFVIDKGTTVMPIEVKYKELVKPEITRSFRSFIDKYRPRKAFVFNLGLDKDISMHKTTIYFRPFYKIGEIKRV